MATEDIEKKILAMYGEERSIRSLVEELVCLRSTHHCQSEGELQALRRKLHLLAEENQQLQAVVDTSEAVMAQLCEDLVRVESERDRLERKLETTGDDSLKQRILFLERELALAERLERVRITSNLSTTPTMNIVNSFAVGSHA